MFTALALVSTIILGVFHEQVWEWLRKLIYSSHRPRVYICTVNGVTGVVKAKDYDNVSKKYWSRIKRRGEHKDWPSRSTPLFRVVPIFLFWSTKDKSEIEGRILGDWWGLEKFLAGCEVEKRNFFIPGINDSSIKFCEDKDKHMDFSESYRYIHNGFFFPRPGVIVFNSRIELHYPLTAKNSAFSYERMQEYCEVGNSC